MEVDELACELLREKFHPAPAKEEPGKEAQGPRELLDFAGTWSEQEYREFMAAIADFGKIDEELWR